MDENTRIYAHIEIATASIFSKRPAIYTTTNMPTVFYLPVFSNILIFSIFFFKNDTPYLFILHIFGFHVIIHQFICLLAICIYFSVNSLFYFFLLLMGSLDFFSLLIYRRSLYIAYHFLSLYHIFAVFSQNIVFSNLMFFFHKEVFTIYAAKGPMFFFLI